MGTFCIGQGKNVKFPQSGNLTGRGVEDEKTKNTTVVFFVVVASKKNYNY